MEPTEKKIRYVAIELIDDNPFQPRKSYDPDGLAELAKSIKEEAKDQDPGYGIIQPGTGRKMADGRYQLAAGHRRLRACRLAGGTVYPFIEKDYTDADMKRIAIIENVQRQDMSHSDTAMAYMSLLSEAGWVKGGDSLKNELAEGKVAKDVGKPASLIRDYIVFASFGTTIQSMVDKGHISFKIIGDLGKLPFKDRMKILNAITSKGMKVADAQALIDAAIKAIQQQLFMETQGMAGDAQALFDVAPVTRSSRFAKALYIEDMARMTECLAKYGDIEAKHLNEALPSLDLNVERERIRIAIATLQRMDKTLQTAQGERRAALICGK